MVGGGEFKLTGSYFLIPMQSSNNSDNIFNYQGIYPCPVCRLGKIQTLPLMEAMACECGSHLFTADMEKQQIKMPERQPPLTWFWNGKTWTGAHLEGFKWGWVEKLFAVGFVMLPTAIIGLAAYTFPPSPDSFLSWLPVAWVGLTFLSHVLITIWLIVEFYQFPVWTYLRLRLRQL